MFNPVVVDKLNKIVSNGVKVNGNIIYIDISDPNVNMIDSNEPLHDNSSSFPRSSRMPNLIFLVLDSLVHKVVITLDPNCLNQRIPLLLFVIELLINIVNWSYLNLVIINRLIRNLNGWLVPSDSAS